MSKTVLVNAFEQFLSRPEITVNGDRLSLVGGYCHKSGVEEKGYLTVRDGKIYIAQSEADWKAWLIKAEENRISASKLQEKYESETGKKRDVSPIRIASNLTHPWQMLQAMLLWVSEVPIREIRSAYERERSRWIAEKGILPNFPVLVQLYPSGRGDQPLLKIEFGGYVK